MPATLKYEQHEASGNSFFKKFAQGFVMVGEDLGDGHYFSFVFIG
jgi:hypothetical protein